MAEVACSLILFHVVQLIKPINRASFHDDLCFTYNVLGNQLDRYAIFRVAGEGAIH